jgi:hypothetical protein
MMCHVAPKVVTKTAETLEWSSAQISESFARVRVMTYDSKATSLAKLMD